MRPVGKFMAMFVAALAMAAGGLVFSGGGFAATPAKANTTAKTAVKPKVATPVVPKTVAAPKVTVSVPKPAAPTSPALGTVTASGKSLAVAGLVASPAAAARRVSFGGAAPQIAGAAAIPHGFGTVAVHTPQSSVHLEMIASN